MCGTRLNMGYLSIQGQAAQRQNVQYSQISNSSESLCCLGYQQV